MKDFVLTGVVCRKFRKACEGTEDGRQGRHGRPIGDGGGPYGRIVKGMNRLKTRVKETFRAGGSKKTRSNPRGRIVQCKCRRLSPITPTPLTPRS